MGSDTSLSSYAYTSLPGSTRPLRCCVPQSFTRRRIKKGLLLIFVLSAIALPLLYYLTTERFWRPEGAYLLEHTVNPSAIAAGQQKLVLVLPVDKSSQNLCKVVASAIAVGYPPPVLVNWNNDFETDTKGIGPSQLGKITGYLNFLEWATSDFAPPEQRLNEEDLVFGIDAHDIWLQLPPSVLIQRYYSINQRANKRIAEQYGFFDKDLMQQTIVVSSQKACVAPRDEISDLHCGDVPGSTLPDSVYGFFTDYNFWFSRSVYVRPKILNSGSFMGPAGDMRRYFQRVKERMEEFLDVVETSGRPQAKVLGGDQGIFAEIFGEQEVWRDTVKKEDFAEDSPNRETAIEKRQLLEYHVGLDYTQEISFQTCYNEWLGYFVPLKASDQIYEESQKAGVAPPRIQTLPADILQAEPPLAKLANNELRTKTWAEMALYMDFWTTAVPIAVHYNTRRKGLKGRLQTWWDATWWFPFLRELLQARMQPSAARETLMILEAADGPLEVIPYLPLDEPKPAMLFVRNTETGNWALTPAADWDAICREADPRREAEKSWYDEVFRDGKGILL
ncbi:hypothetical protein DPSP01_003310 [Paraphaeosphaeria sporulosa]